MASKWMIVSLCAVLQPSIWLYGNILLNWKKRKKTAQEFRFLSKNADIYSFWFADSKEGKTKDI